MNTRIDDTKSRVTRLQLMNFISVKRALHCDDNIAYLLPIMTPDLKIATMKRSLSLGYQLFQGGRHPRFVVIMDPDDFSRENLVHGSCQIFGERRGQFCCRGRVFDIGKPHMRATPPTKDITSWLQEATHAALGCASIDRTTNSTRQGWPLDRAVVRCP